jgi:hypothetical protein
VRKPSAKRAVRSLARIVRDLEVWQGRYAATFDRFGTTATPKAVLLSLVRHLETHGG